MLMVPMSPSMKFRLRLERSSLSGVLELVRQHWELSTLWLRLKRQLKGTLIINQMIKYEVQRVGGGPFIDPDINEEIGGMSFSHQDWAEKYLEKARKVNPFCELEIVEREDDLERVKVTLKGIHFVVCQDGWKTFKDQYTDELIIMKGFAERHDAEIYLRGAQSYNPDAELQIKTAQIGEAGVQMMNPRELRQRAIAFAQSITLGKITLDRIEANLPGWVQAGFITEEQKEELINGIRSLI